MPKAHTKYAQITAIQTVVGSTGVSIDDSATAFGGNLAQLERIKKTIGLDKRRVVEPGVTALDLCLQAAEEIKGKPNYDVLIFVTQTPDHFQPCNAAILHGRLQLSEDCAALDVNLGCSGWVYGLYLASIMIEVGSCRKVLLLAGDTLSRCVNKKDRAAASLFGDAGSATVIERVEEGACSSWFSLHTRGLGSGFIKIPAGAFRQPNSAKTAKLNTDADGNTRSLQDLYMNGAEVFNFSILQVPKAVKEILAYSNQVIDDIDTFFFHQANKYILSNIAKRLKIPFDKVPMQMVEQYGNQSSSSIPATICNFYKNRNQNTKLEVLLSGFGVGLSWASAITTLGALSSCELKPYLAK